MAAAPSPVLSFVGPNSISVRMMSQHDGRGRAWVGTVELSVENDGPAVTSYSFEAHPDPALISQGDNSVSVTSPVAVLKGYQVTTVPVLIAASDNWSSSLILALVVQKPASVKPAVTTLALLRSPQASDYIWPPVLALAFALITLLLTMIVGSSSLTRVGKRRFKKPIHAASTWTFSGSWVTSLAALSAIVTAVLGATGFLADLFPGIDVQRFFSLFVLFNAAILVAPLIYSAAGTVDHKESVGTVGGLLGASAMTLFGVGGQLMTLGILVRIAETTTLTKVSLTLAIAVVVVIIAWYAIATVTALMNLQPAITASEPAGTEPNQMLSVVL
jgi:hypothetical protein